MKKIIVTGGAGYIGSHTVVELAKAGYQPVIVDDLRNSQRSVFKGIERILGDSPSFHEVDVADENALDRIFTLEGPVHGVIHFAALKSVPESVNEPLKYYQNNLSSTLSLLRVMQRNAVNAIVFSSSCTVYGVSPSPVLETAPDRNAESPYGWTKVIGEQMLRDAHAADPSLGITILRYFNPIGAHSSGHIGELPIGVPNNLVPFVTQTAAGVRKSLTVFGDDYDTPDGTCVRDFIHVVDLAQAHVRSIKWMEEKTEPACETFNIGTGNGVSIMELVKRFEAVNGLKLNYKLGPRRTGDIAKIWADTARSKEILGWQAEKTLDEALRDAWNWECKLRDLSEV